MEVLSRLLPCDCATPSLSASGQHSRAPTVYVLCGSVRQPAYVAVKERMGYAERMDANAFVGEGLRFLAE